MNKQHSTKSRFKVINKLLVTALALEICYAAFSIFQGDGQNIQLYIIIYAISFLIFFLAAYHVRKDSNKIANQVFVSIKEIFSNKTLLLIVTSALLFRVTLIPSSPSTSDDVYRYIWEGKILYHGYNPFEYEPENEALKHLHSEELPEKVSFKHMTTIYPTVAQLIFVSGYIISGENDVGLKLIYLLAEFFTIIFIIKILCLRKLNPKLVILYAWLPLPIMEYFINSHIDVIGITFLVMFLYYILQDKYIPAAFPFAFSVLTKLYPLMLLPLLLKKLRLKKTFYFTFITTTIVLLSLYPFVPAGREINESLFTYLSRWSFNGSVYKIFYAITENGYTARQLLLVLFVISVALISLRYNDFLKAVYGVWICFIVFAATVYPWYLGWIAAINPLVGLASVMSLFFTINASNFTPMAPEWTEYLWVSLIQYIPFYILLIWELRMIINKSGTGYFRDWKFRFW